VHWTVFGDTPDHALMGEAVVGVWVDLAASPCVAVFIRPTGEELEEGLGNRVTVLARFFEGRGEAFDPFGALGFSFDQCGVFVFAPVSKQSAIRPMMRTNQLKS